MKTKVPRMLLQKIFDPNVHRVSPNQKTIIQDYLVSSLVSSLKTIEFPMSQL
jgi:hypothetical protein